MVHKYVYYNTAARAVADTICMTLEDATLPRESAYTSVKSQAKLCYNIYATLCLGYLVKS